MGADPQRHIDLIVMRLGSLALVRAQVRRLAENVPVPVAVDDAVLAANELVTNALLYTPGPCRIRGWIPNAGAALRIEVGDPMSTPFPAAPYSSPSLVGGHGLSIVEQLTARWGVELCAPDGKVVWFEIDPRQTGADSRTSVTRAQVGRPR